MNNTFILTIRTLPGGCRPDLEFPMDATQIDVHLRTVDREHDVAAQAFVAGTDCKKVLKFARKMTSACLKRIYKEINKEKEKT
jgi:hypothetical protein